MPVHNDEWCTPEWVYLPYGPFDLDAAASEENHIAPRWITKEVDALTVDWTRIIPPPCRVWCNPPYSRQGGPIEKWIRRFREMQLKGYDIVALVPADTSTKWFHRVWRWARDPELGVTLKFLPRRVRFLDPETRKPGGSPKFGSLIVEFEAR